MFIYIAITLNTALLISSCTTGLINLLNAALNLQLVAALCKAMACNTIQVLPFLYVLIAILFVRGIYFRKCTVQASTINNIYSKRL